jgi:hypothetical protein
MRDKASGAGVREPGVDLLDHVQVVQDVFEAAVIG